MGTNAVRSAAFDMPGGEGLCRKGARPIDLNHLAAQTFGDRALEAEVLAMFCHQAQSVCDRMAGADLATRKTMAHTLKGSARGVGAFGLAVACEAVEQMPGDARLLGEMTMQAARVCDFIATIQR